MALSSPHLKPGSFDHHLSGRGKRRSGSKRSMLSGLMLTPMVDMFSLLVIFLLQAFSASPEILVISKGVTLPNAVTGKELKDAPVIAVTEEGIFLDAEDFGPAKVVLSNPSRLMRKLSDLRKSWVRSNPGKDFPGEITLQAHREVPSTVISQVMSILPSQHFGSIQLAVISGGGPKSL